MTEYCKKKMAIVMKVINRFNVIHKNSTYIFHELGENPKVQVEEQKIPIEAEWTKQEG